MHICLINPSVPRPTFDSTCAQLPPLGLMYIAAYLEQNGHSVDIIDAELYSYSPEEVAELVPEHTGMVGIGGTTFQAENAYAIARLLRRRSAGLRLCYGGPHACAVRREVFSCCDAFDHVVLGGGEFPILALADGQEPETVKGVLSQDPHQKKDDEFADFIDFAQMPLPARHLVPIHAYTGAGRLPYTQASMMITRGCPFKCMFCSSTVFGKTWARRSVPDILNELHVVKDLGFSEVFFQDDTINVDVKWALELFTAIRDAGLGMTYKLCLRVNEKMLPEELLQRMREAGVRHLFYGVESANDDIRNRVSKNINKEEVRRAVALSKRYGFDVTLAFIVGLPGETEETVWESIAFVKELRPYEAGFSTAIPFPGSALRAWALEHDFLTDRRLEALRPQTSVMRTESLSPERIEELRRLAEQETAPYTSHFSNEESQVAHLIDLRAEYVEQNAAELLPFVDMTLARTSFAISHNWQTTLVRLRELLSFPLSRYHRAKAWAMLGYASARTAGAQAMPLEAAEAFWQAEQAGFPEIQAWCVERYRELACGERELLPLSPQEDRENIRRLAAAAQSCALKADVRIIDHAALERLSPVGDGSSYTDTETAASPRLFILDGIFSRPMTDAEALGVLQRLHQVMTDKDRLMLLHRSGPGLGDCLPYRQRILSSQRLKTLTAMAGLMDSTPVDGFIMAMAAALLGGPLPVTNLICLMPASTTVRLRACTLDRHKSFERWLSTSPELSRVCTADEIRKLIAAPGFELLLRYDAALHYDLEDALYSESRAVDYKAVGQWQLDYASLISGALDLRGERLLDFGCAYGAHVWGYRSVGVEAWGVDVNKTFLDDSISTVRPYLRHVPADKPESILAEFPPHSFKAIVATEVFEHVPHAAKDVYCRLFRELLQPGGVCVITCPTGEQDVEDLYAAGCLSDPQHRYLLTNRKMIELFTAHGFADRSKDFRKHIREFHGAHGFSFWCEYQHTTYFCFSLPAEAGKPIPQTSFRTLRARAVMLKLRLPPLPHGDKVRNFLKRYLGVMNYHLARFVPRRHKERLKQIPIVARFIKFLRSS